MINKYLQTGALLLSLVLVLSACTSRKEEISLNTKGFLDAYFKVDYKAASSFCTKELGEELVNSLKSLDNLEPAVRVMLEKQSKEAKTEIISVNSERGKDTATVLYKVILPNFPQGIENTLSLVKMDKKWWVVALGK
ncbi:MAG: hypothetical protein WCX48_06990 [Bacteroidales bacterium]